MPCRTWLGADGAPESLATYLVEARSSGPGRESTAMQHHAVRVPDWMLMTALGAAPSVRGALLLRRTLRRRRRLAARGCCAACGYDLTGNVSGVRPECGERRRVRQ